jgi:hypothetical protein
MKKVFISSVIQNFNNERQAAESAIKSLGLIPIMSEQFDAQPLSPRQACLEGVRKSDFFVAILGKCFGFETTSGKSVCEEEFNEALQIGLPIFVFIQECQREEKQEVFKKSITHYEHGYFVHFFDNCDKLFRQVTESLSQYGTTTAVSITSTEASAHIKLITKINVTDYVSDAIVSVVIMPSDQREIYIPLTELASKEEKTAYQQAALFGSTVIFSPEKGITAVDARKHLELKQFEQHGHLCVKLDLYPDGTLFWTSTINNTRQNHDEHSLFNMHVIDEDLLYSKLISFYNYALWFYQRLSRKKRPIFSFFTSVSLFNKQAKKLGKRPASSPTSMSIGMGFGNSEKPIVFPDQPLNISFAQLTNPQGVTQELMHLMIRAYKAEGLYYTS